MITLNNYNKNFVTSDSLIQILWVPSLSWIPTRALSHLTEMMLPHRDACKWYVDVC